MIHIREEGDAVRSGFNFYPLKSNHAGFVFKLWSFVLTARYSKFHGGFKFGVRKV